MLKELDLKKYGFKEGKKKYQLKEEERIEIKEAFDLFDMEKKGKLDYSELKVTLKALGFEMKKQEVLELIKEYDLDGNGMVEYQDFLDISELKSGEKIC